jgi:hypothetical protein
VNEPAVVVFTVAPRHRAARATWAAQLSKCVLTADLPELVCLAIDMTLLGTSPEVDWERLEKQPVLRWPLLPCLIAS